MSLGITAFRPSFRWTTIRAIAGTVFLLMMAVIPSRAAPTPYPIASGNARFQSSVACPVLSSGDGSTSTSPRGDEPIYDYVILIDISASMVGRDASGNLTDNGHDIFRQVQDSAKEFVGSLAQGSNVVIIPFGDPVKTEAVRTFSFSDANGRQDAKNYIDSLTPNNGSTNITQSVGIALDQLGRMKTDSSQTHVQTILLYTDGQGNGPGDTAGDGTTSPDQLIASLNAFRSDQPFLFVKYVAIDVQVPNRERLEDEAGIQVVEQVDGEVSPVKEIRLEIPQSDLGTVIIGDSVENRLCATSGDLSTPLDVSFAVSPEGLPVDLHVDLKPATGKLGKDGIPLTWTVTSGNTIASTGSFMMRVNVSTTDPDVILVPTVFEVKITIVPPPTVTPTNTPLPTPTATPTNTPVPTATSTAIPTATPTNTPMPTATSTQVPTPTPTRAVALDLPVPFDLGNMDVSSKSEPGKMIEWSKPVPGTFTNGAEIAITFDPDIVSGNSTIDQAAASVQMKDGTASESIIINGRQPAGQATVRIPASSLQQLGDGTHELHGTLIVKPNPGDAEFLPQGAEQRSDGTYRIPVTMKVKVFTPFDYLGLLKKIGLGLLALALLAGLVLVLRAMLPGLPNHSVVRTNRETYPLRGSSATVGTNADDVPLGMSTTAGTIRGGLFKRAMFTAEADDVTIDGDPVEAGKRVKLGPGSTIRSGGSTATFDTLDKEDWDAL